MKKISLTVAIAATLNVNAATEIDYSPAEYLKNYALSVCIAEGYSAKEVKNDAAAAARGYMEFGDYSLEAHTAVRALAKEFLAKPYDSMSGKPMTMAKCIDLVHSQELQAIIKKYQGKDDN
ncbi:type VI secretion protein [Serratia marcescens]|nr:type VI secretion protein [Serratia marcescens]NDY50672.1 type VI secretion protein [Serratia marcescens]NDY63158.1 type VI secretion protein [Serratia marcescens]NDY67900.1 type VI secretion protein [Serratia marcescens]NDY77141.1 type VI secretion protein [Serratia marcescens]